jgi:uncharacterized protein with beta-barrel porin domain
VDALPGTSVLNVNTLTSDIAPAIGSGQPGILFFGSGAITLVSATSPFRIVISDDFVDGIVAQSDGAIKATTSGNIAIKGLFANGINLLSFAGGAINLASSSDISLAQGGNGILAYSDGTVALTSSGAISVTGDGTGINATAGTHVTVSSSGPISITGDGDAIDATDIGESSAGGGVTVNSSGAITLAGNSANGIDASSEATDPVSITSSSNMTLTNGGAGITASGSGAVTVNSSGEISVAGGTGAGIVAASGEAGTVSVKSSGNISIEGNGVGIVAVSVGGAAGVMSSGNVFLNGSGIGISAIGGTDASVSSSGSISVGGDGNAISAISANGTASITSLGSVSLGGDGAAIAAVSVGGAAGLISSGNVFLNGSGIGISAIGGTDASVSSSGSISVGGDGNAISAISANGTASITSLGSVSLGGDGAAIAAVSVGGAANVTSSGNVLVGGSGTGIVARGSVVQVTSSGNIAVAKGGTGIDATGGNGAIVGSSGGISIGGNGNAIDASSTGGAANVTSSGNILIGGSGTAIDALGNLVQVNSSGNISLANGGTGIKASGDGQVAVNSSGVISLGGNGTAIDAFSVAGATKVNSPGNIFIGGSGTGIAAGGNLVQVNASGDISLAKGGTGISAFGGNQVAVNSSGNISVGGEYGFGIAALDTYKGGVVSINSSGDVTAAGPASTAILAQATGGDIAVNIARGTITGGSGTGAGIELIGGGNNTLANAGTITTSAGLAGTAILGMPAPGLPPTSTSAIGNNVVNNAGTIIGNVNLGPGRNAFNNLPGGTLNSGAALMLGSGNSLNNSGNLSPGGVGVLQTTALTGNLVQGGAGKITVDINPATGQVDRINASGNAQLAGQVVVNPIAGSIPTVTTPFTILHADGGVTDQGLTLVGADLLSSAVVTPELKLLDPSDLALVVAVDFAPAGLNGNQTSIGKNINAIQLAGSSPSFLPVAQALVAIPDLAGLGQAYNQLSPETYGDNEIADFYSDLRFASSLMSCDVPDGRYVFIKEGQCVWAQLGGKFLDLNATSGSLGFGENAFVMSGGAEMMLRPDWFASFAFGYDHGNIDTADGLAQSQANRAHFGAAIKYNPGPFLFAAAVYGGYGWYATDRLINFADFSAIAASDSGISNVGGQFRAAYLIDRGSWYLKPLIDFNVTHVSLNSFSEQGAGGASLIVSGTGSTVFSASPAVQIGTQTSLQNGVLLRPFAQLGVSAFSNTNFTVDASFNGAPSGIAPFGVATGIDSVTADVAAGADMFLPDSRWALKLVYSGHYGARVRDQGVTLKASFRF